MIGSGILGSSRQILIGSRQEDIRSSLGIYIVRSFGVSVAGIVFVHAFAAHGFAAGLVGGLVGGGRFHEA